MMDEISEHAEPIKARARFIPTLKVPKLFQFLVLWLLIFTLSLHITLPSPFLTYEIVKVRKENEITGGILAGVYPITSTFASFIPLFVPVRPSSKQVFCWSGIALFFSSIVFAIPISENFLFDAIVFISR